MTGRTSRRRILHIDVPAPSDAQAVLGHRPDLLAAEEPLEIRVNDRPLSVTMRTPGDDIDLAAGFLAA
jgi:FdhD protein